MKKTSNYTNQQIFNKIFINLKMGKIQKYCP